jgi:ribonuclease HI
MSNQPNLIAYADGSCLGNPGPGGWGVVLVGNGGSRLEFSGAAPCTTNNRMEITAAIEALRKLPPDVEVTLCTDSQYLVKTMTLGWKRRENLDLWKVLDVEAARRKVRWQWVRGHSGHSFNERADELARNAALGRPQEAQCDSLMRLSTITDSQATDEDSPQGNDEAAVIAKSSRTQDASAIAQPTSRNGEETSTKGEEEIAPLLRPLLAKQETLRRCANCGRAFVATGHPPRMRAYCSLIACQLKRRS